MYPGYPSVALPCMLPIVRGVDEMMGHALDVLADTLHHVGRDMTCGLYSRGHHRCPRGFPWNVAMAKRNCARRWYTALVLPLDDRSGLVFQRYPQDPLSDKIGKEKGPFYRALCFSRTVVSFDVAWAVDFGSHDLRCDTGAHVGVAADGVVVLVHVIHAEFIQHGTTGVTGSG